MPNRRASGVARSKLWLQNVVLRRRLCACVCSGSHGKQGRTSAGAEERDVHAVFERQRHLAVCPLECLLGFFFVHLQGQCPVPSSELVVECERKRNRGIPAPRVTDALRWLGRESSNTTHSYKGAALTTGRACEPRLRTHAPDAALHAARPLDRARRGRT